MLTGVERTTEHMDVTINDKKITIPGEIDTWGDLLDWIETDHLQAGQCITHVYLGGSEMYNYRDRFVCQKELNAIGHIAVHSGDFDKVVHESLAELDRELKNALVTSEEIICLLANRKEEEAYTLLAQLLESMRMFFTIFSEDLGWVDPTKVEISRKEFSVALSRALNQLMSAQEKRYWGSICDVVEYEITPILESWQKM